MKASERRLGLGQVILVPIIYNFLPAAQHDGKAQGLCVRCWASTPSSIGCNLGLGPQSLILGIFNCKMLTS